jgi:hypothetical protein
MGKVKISTLRLGLTSGLLMGVAFGIWLAAGVGRKMIFGTGETTEPGTLTCLNCGTQLNFAEAGRVPPCGNCHGTEFGKSS